MRTEKTPTLVVPGLPLFEKGSVNRVIENSLAWLTRKGSSDIYVAPLEYKDPSGFAIVDRIGEHIDRLALKKGPLRIVTMSASVDVVLAAIEGRGPEVVDRMVGIAGPVDMRQGIPAEMRDRVRANAPALEELMEHFRDEIFPRLRQTVTAPTLSLFSVRDESVPSRMSDSWAERNVEIWTPPIPAAQDRGLSHAATIVQGLRSRVLPVFMQESTRHPRTLRLV